MQKVLSSTSDAASAIKDRQQRELGRFLAGLGVMLFTGPLWCVISALIRIWRSLRMLEDYNYAGLEITPMDFIKTLAFTPLLTGIAIGLLGVVVILIALYISKNREKWFFWSVMLVSLYWCLLFFPIGGTVGIPIGVIFYLKRAEFFPDLRQVC